MKALSDRGAAQQIAGIVILSLLAAHGLTMLIWLSFDMRPGPPPQYMRPAAQIGLVLRLLEALPAAEQPAVLAVAQAGGLMVQPGAGRPPTSTGTDDAEIRGVYHALAQEPGLKPRIIEIGREPAAGSAPGSFGVLMGFAGPVDHWLLFKFAAVDDWHTMPLHWMSPSGFASVALVPVLMALISIWGTSRVTRPLVRLAAATRNLSILQDPPPVAEEGTPEVRQVAHAFNELVARLHRFVADRTRTLAAVSHDLRTPLTRLRLRAETVPDDETRTRMLNDIRTMESMITATLAFIREEAEQEAMERMDMAVMLQTICDEFADTGCDVRYDGPLHCAASCRPQALQRALNNLIENAVKFGATATARLTMNDTQVVISIEDDGPGISDAEKAAVLKPFFRGDTARTDPHGAGLGLSIVNSIVASHDGRIILSDRIPQGLCVQIYLPVIQQTTAAVHP